MLQIDVCHTISANFAFHSFVISEQLSSWVATVFMQCFMFSAVMLLCDQTMKTYHLYHGRSRQSHSKLQRVQTQRRVELESKKSASSKRVQRYDKQTEKVYIAFFCYLIYYLGTLLKAWSSSGNNYTVYHCVR